MTACGLYKILLRQWIPNYRYHFHFGLGLLIIILPTKSNQAEPLRVHVETNGQIPTCTTKGSVRGKYPLIILAKPKSCAVLLF